MSDSYRKEVSYMNKEARWTFWKVLPTVLLVLVVLGGIGFGLRSVGLIGSTIVEREVFTHSYQRSSALKAQIATDEATLVEITRKLSNPNLDANTRANLEAQASAARIRINTARSQQ